MTAVPLLARILPALLAFMSALPATAQDYPTKPIRFTICCAPGGSADLVTRLLAEKMTARMGQPVLPENRIGGSGVLANSDVVKAAPDGHTMVLLTGGFPVAAVLVKDRPYDPIKDFQMVSTIVSYPFFLSVAADHPVKSLKELLARAKANPGKITYAVAGPGSVHHLLGEWVNIEGNVDMINVPFKGAQQALIELYAGRLDVLVETATGSMGAIRSGKARAIAVSSPQRFSLMPDVPTINETLPGIELASWLGVATTPGTPRPVVDKLNRELRTILAMPDVQKRLADLGGVATPSTPEEMRQRIEGEMVRWKRIIDIKKIQPQ
jgi:tripartite-type tricarboxylate transporter receptor subunit TctC